MTKEEIINDLMRRKPKGPPGVDIEYEVCEGEYNWRTGKYKTYLSPSVEDYGYTDDQLFDLGFKDRTDVLNYIRIRDFEGQSDWSLGRRKATLNRRVNKIWNRISFSVRRVTRVGGEGIYSVHQQYSRCRTIGHLFSRNKEEALELSKLFFGYLFPNEGLRVDFVQRGGVIEIESLNASCVASHKDLIERAKKEIESLQMKIETHEAALTTLHTVASQQLAVESVAALDEAAAYNNLHIKTDLSDT